MITIETALVLSVVSVAFAVYQGVANLKRNQKTDDRNEATQLTTVIVKLETISNGISEIKNELINVKKDIGDDRERIVKVEESAKSAHKRIDTCEQYCKKLMGGPRE